MFGILFIHKSVLKYILKLTRQTNMALYESFEKFKLDELEHPSHIKLHHPGERKLEYINAMYSNYQELIKHLKDVGAPQEDIDKAEQKAKELFAHLHNLK